MSDDIIALFAIAITFLLPIVVVLTKHQQKMTALLHQQHAQQQLQQQPSAQPVGAQEIAALRDLIAQQAIAIDNLQNSTNRLHQRLDEQSALEQRIGV